MSDVYSGSHKRNILATLFYLFMACDLFYWAHVLLLSLLVSYFTTDYISEMSYMKLLEQHAGNIAIIHKLIHGQDGFNRSAILQT